MRIVKGVLLPDPPQHGMPDSRVSGAAIQEAIVEAATPMRDVLLIPSAAAVAGVLGVSRAALAFVAEGRRDPSSEGLLSYILGCEVAPYKGYVAHLPAGSLPRPQPDFDVGTVAGQYRAAEALLVQNRPQEVAAFVGVVAGKLAAQLTEGGPPQPAS